MPIQFKHGLLLRHTCFCFNYIEDLLWTTKSRLFIVRPSKITSMSKYKKLLFIKTRSLDGVSSNSQLKEVSFYLSCHIDFKDSIKKKMIVSSNLSSFQRENQSSSAFKSIDLKVLSKIVYINKFTSYKTLLSHSILLDEYSGATMHGWCVSMAKSKDTQEWRQFWIDGRRTHMGHAHGHDNHESHEKLGAYGEKILRWGLWSDIMLTFGKVAAGYVSGSTAIIADAAHSASDIQGGAKERYVMGCWLLTYIIWLRF